MQKNPVKRNYEQWIDRVRHGIRSRPKFESHDWWFNPKIKAGEDKNI